jgi:hypothetical protein
MLVRLIPFRIDFNRNECADEAMSSARPMGKSQAEAGETTIDCSNS